MVGSSTRATDRKDAMSYLRGIAKANDERDNDASGARR